MAGVAPLSEEAVWCFLPNSTVKTSRRLAAAVDSSTAKFSAPVGSSSQSKAEERVSSARAIWSSVCESADDAGSEAFVFEFFTLSTKQPRWFTETQELG